VEDVKADPLNTLELKYLLSALFFFVSEYSAVGYVVRKRHTIAKFGSSIRNEEVHRLLSKAVKVFHGWPANYFAFLDWRKENARSTKHVRGLSRDFGEYKYTLYEQLAAPPFDFMRRAFEEYITTVWDGGYVSGMSRLSKSALENKKYASKSEAAKLLSVPPSRIDLFLSERKLKGVIRRQGQSRMLLIELCSINDLKPTLKNRELLSAHRASKRLGTPSAQIAVLKSRNFLQRLQMTDVPGRFGYSLQEIDGLLKKLESYVPVKPRLFSNQTIRLTHTLRSLRCCELGLGDLLGLIFERTLHLVGMNKRLGLSGLKFSPQEIYDFVRGQQAKKYGNAVRIREAARKLGLDVNETLSLVKKGLLTAYKESTDGRAVLMISDEAISEFSVKYCLSASLAAELHTVSNYVMQILEEKGIKPVSGPKIDGGKRYVYAKNRMAEIDLPALLKERRRAAHQEHEMARLVNVGLAAELLETTPDTIVELVAACVLKPNRSTTRKQRLNHDYWFARHGLEKFRRKISQYSGLISVGLAARMLGRNSRSVRVRYMYTKRLKEVRVAGNTIGYLRRKDVEALIESERQIVTSMEAAAILKVSMSQIFRMATFGPLKPISGPAVDGYALNLFSRTDVESLRRVRQSFRLGRIKEGGSSRFGAPAGQRFCPVLNQIGPRVDELVGDLSGQENRPSAVTVHGQLLKEGYTVGINSVYLYLRNYHPKPKK
jgi:hypothetical protein